MEKTSSWSAVEKTPPWRTFNIQVETEDLITLLVHVLWKYLSKAINAEDDDHDVMSR